MNALRGHYCSIWSHLGDRLASIDLASRAGLVCGAVLGAAMISSAIVLLDWSAAPVAPPSPAPTFVSAAKTFARALPRSRLPRSRPEEPRTTGSIAPASDRSAAAAAPGQGNTARADRLRDKAILIASAWPDCDRVENSEAVAGSDRSGAHIMVLIECANGTGVYLDEAEIESSRLPVPVDRVVGRLSDRDAIGVCEEKLRIGLAVPRSFSRGAADVERAAEGDAVVTFDFSTVNGFGFPLALQAECVFAERELARLQVAPR